MLYVLLFVCAFLVDLIPFIGPPAWTVIVFFHLKYDLDIWAVLSLGVLASALGRYCLALYMPLLGKRMLSKQKDEDLKFLGSRLNSHPWRTQGFVLFYTLLPVPSTPLFTVAGLSKMNPIRIIPAFFVGKFISDALMVYAGKLAIQNIENIVNGIVSWEALAGSLLGVSILLLMLFIDWKHLLINKKLRIGFSIWK